ncbi:hypothetical protein R1sor_019891 [Riccia sorocarpa]|uniref:Uncharacterized protein n=1 Tax=Riccia sorocarpa TaxID=122646 RepID=A0ABD3IK15_9MARC
MFRSKRAWADDGNQVTLPFKGGQRQTLCGRDFSPNRQLQIHPFSTNGLVAAHRQTGTHGGKLSGGDTKPKEVSCGKKAKEDDRNFLTREIQRLSEWGTRNQSQEIERVSEDEGMADRITRISRESVEDPLQMETVGDGSVN